MGGSARSEDSSKHGVDFSVRDKGFMTGTKVWLTYQINGSDPQCWAQIFWDNPFIGTTAPVAGTSCEYPRQMIS
jgi:hypothetical protein